ncbi:hypothetical protein V1512DRAFT_264357 [Lipomyces arxii]|uniref:uncharacterized protein n=1 Tax=Lipomyces arxii TaxID=56418 RepID=UPI0034CE613B
MDPDFDVLVNDVFEGLRNKPTLIEISSPNVQSRILSMGSSGIVNSSNATLASHVLSILHTLSNTGYIINGIKRLDNNTLLASVIIDDLELVWIRLENSWKLHEVRLYAMDEYCYWRSWLPTVAEAEHAYVLHLQQKRTHNTIKTLLLASNIISHQSLVSHAELQFKSALLDHPGYCDTSASSLSERDYWADYDDNDDGECESVAPSPELANSLRTIKFLQTMYSDDNSPRPKSPIAFVNHESYGYAF